MRFHFSLRAWTFLLLTLLVIFSFAGGMMTLFFVHKLDRVYSVEVPEGIKAFESVVELQNSLVMQKGFVTYFFLTNDEQWVDQLNIHHDRFSAWLLKTRNVTPSEMGRIILNDIDHRYIQYAHDREAVIKLYREGKRAEGSRLHLEARKQFFNILTLCDQVKALHKERLDTAWKNAVRFEGLIYFTAVGGMICSVVFGLLLAYILDVKILRPIRQLAQDPTGQLKKMGVADEVTAMKTRMLDLLESVDQTRSKLEESRGHLQQSEKLAMVGRLAASVAHSIRNPLTSVKMRLFSLERSLSMNTVQRDDFAVISEEIRHIDAILRNFLEFSRRPKLKFQSVDPAEVVQMALQLMRHRFESHNIDVQVDGHTALPNVRMDVDQIKEVLINIFENACDAMGNRGRLSLYLDEGVVEPLKHVVIIRISDTGPGIPENVLSQLFQPFFSTKEEGTGLGLSIAKRIVEEHGGWLNVKSKEGEGATFIITLPCKGETTWARF